MNASPQDPSNTRCAACGQPLEGWYTRDMWGNATCSRHEAEFPRCSACTRLICPRLTGGGVTYADGRQVCMLCRRTAIDSKFSDCLHLPDLGDQPDDQAVLQYAMGREHAAMTHYGELAETTPPGPIRDLFKYLASEETKHKLELEKLYYETVHRGGGV